MNQDADQIKILAIFHYVVAGIAGIFACFPIFHLLMGLTLLTGSFFPSNAPGSMPFPFSMFGLIFTLIPAAIIFFGWHLPSLWGSRVIFSCRNNTICFA